MFPKTIKFKKYKITYTSKEEFKILTNEIFTEEIYKTNISNPSPTIFDVGSHIGLSILYFKTIYPNAKITGFEPNQNTFPILEENIYSNNIDNVTLHNIALGLKNTNRKLYIDTSGECAFSTSSFTKNAWNGKQLTKPITVKTKKLSTYIDKEIDLLKIDVEGAELEIIKDLYNTGKITMVKNIIIEYHPTKESNLKNLLKHLKDFKDIKQKDLGENLILIHGKQRA